MLNINLQVGKVCQNNHSKQSLFVTCYKLPVIQDLCDVKHNGSNVIQLVTDRRVRAASNSKQECITLT